MKLTVLNSTAPEQAVQLLQDDHQISVHPELLAEANGRQSKIVKWFFGILLMVVIFVGMLFAREGAAFMFGTAGTIIAWVLGLLSIAGLIAFLKGWLPKSLKWVLFILEIVNIGYDSYVAGGQWGRPSANSYVVNHLDDRIHESGKFVTSINAFWELNNSLGATATTVQEQEASRDGKGSIWEAAGKVIGDFPNHSPVSVTFDSISKDVIAEYSSLGEILDFAARYQRGIADQESKFIGEAEGVKQKAAAFADYLGEIESKMAKEYREERRANLMRLRAAITQLAEYTLPAEAPTGKPLTKSEINESISWGDHYVIPLLFIIISGTLILILFFWGNKGADRTNFDRQVTLLLANQKLQQSGLRHTLRSDWFPELREMQLLDLMDDPQLLVSIQRSGFTYERLLTAYVSLGQENFVAIMMGTSKWKLGEAIKVAENPEFSTYLHEIINDLTPKQWSLIEKFVDRPSDVLQLSSESLLNVLALIEALKNKMSGNDELVNSTVDRLFIEGADDRYYTVLLRLIEVAANVVQINAISSRLAKVVTVESVETVVKILGSCPNDTMFQDVASKWQLIDTKTVESLQSLRLLSQLDMLIQKCVRGGYYLLRSLFDAYEQAQQDVSTGLARRSISIDNSELAIAYRINDASDLQSQFTKIFTIS
jgi:hypothetical protein